MEYISTKAAFDRDQARNTDAPKLLTGVMENRSTPIAERKLEEGPKILQKTFLNYSSSRDVPQLGRKPVAQWEEAILQGQVACFEYPKHIKISAQNSVNRIQNRRLNGDQSTTDPMVTVNLDTIDTECQIGRVCAAMSVGLR